MFSNRNLLKQNDSHGFAKQPPADARNEPDNTTGPGGKLNAALQSLKFGLFGLVLKAVVEQEDRVCLTCIFRQRAEAKTSQKSFKSVWKRSDDDSVGTQKQLESVQTNTELKPAAKAVRRFGHLDVKQTVWPHSDSESAGLRTRMFHFQGKTKVTCDCITLLFPRH